MVMGKVIDAAVASKPELGTHKQLRLDANSSYDPTRSLAATNNYTFNIQHFTLKYTEICYIVKIKYFCNYYV